MFICLVRQYCSTRYEQLITACSLFGQYLSTLVPQYSVQTFTTVCLFAQYVSTVILGTDIHHGMFICLVRQCLSTRYGQLITACSSFVQCLSTLVAQYLVQTLTTACLFLSTLVLLYSVRTTHHGVFFICLVPQYVSTVVLSTACSSFVWCASTLVPQYSLQTLTTACLFAQYVSTLALGMDNSSRRVLYLFSALIVPQYRNTRYRHTPRHIYFLVRQYLSTRFGLFFICLVCQYVSTVLLGTDNLSRLVLHLFSAIVRQYRSTRYRHSPRHVQCASTLVLQYLVRTTHHGLLFICLAR